MKKILSFVLALSLLLSLGTLTALASEKVEITFWKQLFEEFDQEWTTKMVDEFNAQSDKIHVNLEFVDQGALAERMTAARAAGTAPDVYIVNYSNLATDVRQGYNLPTTSLIPKEAYEDLYDNVLEMMTVDGEVYGYPHLLEPAAVMYYRKDMLEAAGFDHPPKTWQEHIDMAKAMTTGDVFGTTMNTEWSMWGWEHTAMGHWPLTEDWTKADIKDLAPLLNYIKKLYDDESAPAQALDGYNSSAQLVANDSVAITFSGSWGIGALRNDWPEMVDKIGVAAVPTEDGKPFQSTMGGWTYQIDAKSKNPEAAAEFITWLLADDPSRPAAFFEAAHFSKYTVRKSVDKWLVENTKASEDEWLQVVARDIIPYGIKEPSYPWDVSAFLLAAMNEVVINGVSAEEALATAEKEINAFIENSKLVKPQ